MDLSDVRKDYSQSTLSEKDLLASPFDLLAKWMQEAIDQNLIDPNAMALSTCSTSAIPSIRMVLVKKIDSSSLHFFTNLESKKATELTRNPHAACNFYWRELERQVCIEGTCTPLSQDEVVKYFHKRSRQSQLAAWASKQGSRIESRKTLELAYETYEKQFEGKEVELPPYWGGFAVKPHRVEFWQGRKARLSDRFCYEKTDKGWDVYRVSP